MARSYRLAEEDGEENARDSGPHDATGGPAGPGRSPGHQEHGRADERHRAGHDEGRPGGPTSRRRDLLTGSLTPD
jgi:hypothetical protein